MTISSVNLAMGMSHGAYQQKLSQETKRKLDELGIPYDQNTTEQEAQSLIAQKLQQNANQQSGEQGNNLYKQALQLAKKLGINVDKNIDFKSLLQTIEAKIEQLVMQNKDNEQMLNQLKSYSFELSNIQAQSAASMGYDNTNQVLMKSLELLSQYNKNLLY